MGLTKIPFFGEEDFQEQMDTTVADWRAQHVKRVWLTSYDGTKLAGYVAKNPQEKASITIVHGFTEFWAKYHEMAYYMYEAGYSVYFLELRGHGYSAREIPGDDKVYIRDYEEYVQDVRAFTEEVVKPGNISGKFLLFAHSMGGCVSALYLEEYPTPYQAVMLSSPMFELDYGKVKPWQLKALFAASVVLRWDHRLAPGQHTYSDAYTYPKCSQMSEARYKYVYDNRKNDPHNQMEGGTYAWVRASMNAMKRAIANASQIKIPVLLCQAGADNMVKPGGQNTFAARCSDCRIQTFPGSKHEIFNATEGLRRNYYRTLWEYFGEHAKAEE